MQKRTKKITAVKKMPDDGSGFAEILRTRSSDGCRDHSDSEEFPGARACALVRAAFSSRPKQLIFDSSRHGASGCRPSINLTRLHRRDLFNCSGNGISWQCASIDASTSFKEIHSGKYFSPSVRALLPTATGIRMTHREIFCRVMWSRVVRAGSSRAGRFAAPPSTSALRSRSCTHHRRRRRSCRGSCSRCRGRAT